MGEFYVPDKTEGWRISARKYYTYHRMHGSTHRSLIGTVEEIRRGDKHRRLYRLEWRHRAKGGGYPFWRKIAHHR